MFLFFYGLERRILVDAVANATAKADIPAIKQEVRRLLAIYSDNGSFRHYALQFLAYVESESVEPAIYKKPPPAAGGS